MPVNAFSLVAHGLCLSRNPGDPRSLWLAAGPSIPRLILEEQRKAGCPDSFRDSSPRRGALARSAWCACLCVRMRVCVLH